MRASDCAVILRASDCAVILRAMKAFPSEPSPTISAAPRPLRVAFLCVQNANRSQMAEAWARLLGGDRIEAWSAGTQPGGLVHPKAV